jgi:hypothetical protein
VWVKQYSTKVKCEDLSLNPSIVKKITIINFEKKKEKFRCEDGSYHALTVASFTSSLLSPECAV